MATSFPRLTGPARLGLPLAATALVAAACGSSGSTGSGGHSPSTQSGKVIVKTAKGSSADFLTDGTGHALYLWLADRKNTSTCFGSCATYWPPLIATGQPTAGGAAVAADLGTITRKDGRKQVTYAGHPLYLFAGDRAPGQTSGQGSNNFGAKWWLVAPSGQQITGSDHGPGGAASKSSGGGYGY